MSSSDDDDAFANEVDKFSKQRRAAAGTFSFGRQPKAKDEEVLNVEGSSDDDDDDDDGDEDNAEWMEDDQQSDDDQVGADKWGGSKSGYYGTGYVDRDFGGMGSSDEEDAELEEEDAIKRQRRLDALLVVDDEDADDVSALAKAADDDVVVERELTSDSIGTANESLDDIINEWDKRRQVYDAVIRPLKELVEKMPGDSDLTSRLNMAFGVYSTYMLHLSTCIQLKSEQFAAGTVSDPATDSHPVFSKMRVWQKRIASVDEFLSKNSEVIMKLQKRASKGKDISRDRIHNKSASSSAAAHKKSSVDREQFARARQATIDDGDMENGPEDEDDDGRRAVSYEIEKNAQRKKKKKLGHSRVKRRHQYDRAVYKKRSQVPDVRPQTKRYEGESRGIRISTIKSIKL